MLVTSPPLFQLQGVAKKFAAKTILKSIELHVEKKESLVIVGPSGCGKSVLIKLILGLLPLDSGTVHLEGKDVSRKLSSKNNPFYQRSGMLFQYAALFDSLPVWENVVFHDTMHRKHTSRQALKEQAIALLKEVGLEPEVANLYPAEISGGMKKRVALARAFSHQPDILFCDEPTTGLDPIAARLIDELIRSLSQNRQTTVITITHDMQSVRRLADRVAFLHKGRIYLNDSPDALFNNPDPIIQNFIQEQSE